MNLFDPITKKIPYYFPGSSMKSIINIYDDYKEKADASEEEKTEARRKLEEKREKYICWAIFLAIISYFPIYYFIDIIEVYGHNGYSYWLVPEAVYIISAIVSLILAIIVYRSAYTKPHNRIDEDLKLEQAKLKEEAKKAIYKTLKDKTVRSVAGIPQGAVISKHLPKDEEYERFTSVHGKYFHKSRECAKKYVTYLHTEHAFLLPGTHFLPCPHCAEAIEFPEWYSNYLTLVKLSRYFSFEITDDAYLGEYNKTKSEKYWHNLDIPYLNN